MDPNMLGDLASLPQEDQAKMASMIDQLQIRDRYTHPDAYYMGKALPNCLCKLPVRNDTHHWSANADTPLMNSLNPVIQNHWIETQSLLKKKLITSNNVKWKLPIKLNKLGGEAESSSSRVLKYLGGVDLSFSKEDLAIACGTLVVLDLNSLEVVYEDYSVVKLTVPYVPGFLAFREVPVLLELLEKMKASSHPFYPQVLMVDGNGILHPRGFGLACHLGVLANLPTIGIGKNLHHVDGLTQSMVRKLFEVKKNMDDEVIPLVGDSGETLGAALRTSQGSLRPIFVSIGHCISLDAAIDIVKICSKYRIPEPIRQADIKSREHLKKNQMGH